jgi:hypothetical protein
LGIVTVVPRHHTKDKGDLAQAKVYADLIERGAMVLFPMTEHAPFDLVAYLDGSFYRIQVKFRSARNGVLPLQFRSVWADRHGVHARPMPRSEVDVVAAYSPDTGKCYYIDPSDFGESVNLRISEPRNSQSANVTIADDFCTMPPRRRRPS